MIIIGFLCKQLKFYNREKELKKLKNIEELSKERAKMTIIVGRRRIGKTTLIKEAYSKKLYFFVSKKNEALLCEEFIKINEIDIVAINEEEKRVVIGEVKRNPKKIDLYKLEQKALKLTAKLKKYNVEYRGFSLLDM